MTQQRGRAMLRSMAIRMKEWGMQAYPRQGVHLPQGSLHDWGRTGRVLGQGVQGAATGAVELAAAIHRVQSAGDEADMAGMLEEIGRETTRELLDLPVRDWDYSWQQAYGARVQEMLGQFSGEAREKAQRMSETYGVRYSMEGQRQMELARIRRARTEWQKQVDSAVQRGDADAAGMWVEQGRELFVPETQMQQMQQKTRSRCLQHRWQQQLHDNPYDALESWQNDAAEKPAGDEELRHVETAMEQQKASLLGQLATRFAADLAQGNEPDEALLAQAAAAGVLQRDAAEKARQKRQPLSATEACNWLRRIDERGAGQDDALAVDIVLAPAPLRERQRLLQRMMDTAQLPPAQRVATSRRLWNMYADGLFGCPGDAEALQCLGRMQEEALSRQISGNAVELQQWLDSLHAAEDNWICFDAE